MVDSCISLRGQDELPLDSSRVTVVGECKLCDVCARDFGGDSCLKTCLFCLETFHAKGLNTLEEHTRALAWRDKVAEAPHSVLLPENLFSNSMLCKLCTSVDVFFF